MSRSCMFVGRSFNFSYSLLSLLTHWRRSSGGRWEREMVKFTPRFVCCWSVRDVPLVRFVLGCRSPCETAREGSQWDDESGLRSPATHWPGNFLCFHWHNTINEWVKRSLLRFRHETNSNDLIETLMRMFLFFFGLTVFHQWSHASLEFGLIPQPKFFF